MRLRWKLMLLLLAIALPPVLAVRGVDVWSTWRLGMRIGQDQRQLLTDMAKQQLRTIVLDRATMLHLGTIGIELSVAAQADAVERALEYAKPTEYTFFTAKRFTVPGMAPPDLQTHRAFYRIESNGTRTYQPISFSHVSIWFAPNSDLAQAQTQLKKLRAMAKVYATIRARSGSELPHWQYTAMASGLHIAYPGHGGYPEDYDSRLRPWYRMAIEADELTWTVPSVDATSRRVVIACVKPVRDPQQNVIGITGIDVPITKLMGQVELPADWQDHARIMIAGFPEARTKSTTQPGSSLLNLRHPKVPVIFAHMQYAADHKGTARWQTAIELPCLLTDTRSDAKQQIQSDLNNPAYRQMVDQIAAGQSGMVSMTYNGQPALWGYAPISNKSALVIILPEKPLVARAQAVELQVLDLTFQKLLLVAPVVGLVILAVIFAAWYASKRVTSDVHLLVHTAERIAGGNLDATVDIQRGDEIGDLAISFNHMIPKLREHMRMASTLSLANQVQSHLLPTSPPHVDLLDIAGKALYCDETGGDYFDFVVDPFGRTGELAVIVGDVTGHGVAAALTMTAARAMLKSRMDHPTDLATIFNDMNHHMEADAIDGRFMTLSCMILAPARREIRWLSAGHDPIILYQPQTDQFEELPTVGIPLGIEAQWHYPHENTQSIAAGSMLIQSTDGIWEQRNPNGEQFGKERLQSVIRANAHQSAQQIMEQILKAVHDFRAGEPQADDITIVVIKLPAASAGA